MSVFVVATFCTCTIRRNVDTSFHYGFWLNYASRFRVTQTKNPPVHYTHPLCNPTVRSNRLRVFGFLWFCTYLDCVLVLKSLQNVLFCKFVYFPHSCSLCHGSWRKINAIAVAYIQLACFPVGDWDHYSMKWNNALQSLFQLINAAHTC